MLTLYARLTKLFRTLEQKAKVAAHDAGNRARVAANDARVKLIGTAASMRESAALEERAEADLHDEMNRIETLLEGI